MAIETIFEERTVTGRSYLRIGINGIGINGKVMIESFMFSEEPDDEDYCKVTIEKQTFISIVKTFIQTGSGSGEFVDLSSNFKVTVAIQRISKDIWFSIYVVVSEFRSVGFSWIIKDREEFIKALEKLL
jgi:hypothetical protein